MLGFIVTYSGAKGTSALTLIQNALSGKPLNLPSGWQGLDDLIAALLAFEAAKGLSSLLSSLPAAAGGGGGGGNEGGSTPEEPTPEEPTPSVEPDIPIE